MYLCEQSGRIANKRSLSYVAAFLDDPESRKMGWYQVTSERKGFLLWECKGERKGLRAKGKNDTSLAIKKYFVDSVCPAPIWRCRAKRQVFESFGQIEQKLQRRSMVEQAETRPPTIPPTTLPTDNHIRRYTHIRTHADASALKQNAEP